ncbi:MAG: peptidoglycan editing factor PgeF [Anaerolineales bacterium]|nr:peptidoglycan editing factor PgeF [Anaerolineales bacterium]
MIVQQAGAIRYYQFESFAAHALIHGILARHGGVSAAPWASLNMSVTVGDSAANVRANRERAFHALGRPPESVADLWMVHSAEVVIAETPRDLTVEAAKADAILTDNPAVTLFLRFADCVPILLYDARRRAIGLVHAGWRGTLLRTAGAAVRAMTERYGSRPAEIVAGIGPSIGPCHYEVGPEVAAQTRAAFNGQAESLLAAGANGRPHLDLWAANALTLRLAGVAQIEVGQICTACRTDDFFSHRGEHGQTGRFGALLALA